MTQAATYDLLIEQGATFNLSAQWIDASGNPVVLTNWHGTLQVRAKYSDTTILLQLDDSTGGIALDQTEGTATTGTVTLYLSPSQTSALTWAVGLYDLLLTAPEGTEIRLLSGQVTVSPAVTR